MQQRRWRSSPYYLAELPAWVEDFNARRDLDAYLGTVWAPLPVDAATLEEMAIERVDLGPLAATFPHPFGGLQPAADPTFYAALTVSPWLDVYLARFAEHLIETQGLGGDAIPDVLALGFSSLDLVGHQYGPNSREALDTVLRLDRTLGELLDFVDRRVGLDRVVVGLSGDHGVPPLPEFRERHGLPGTRAGAAEIVCLQQVGEQLAARFGEGAVAPPRAISQHQPAGARGPGVRDRRTGRRGPARRVPIGRAGVDAQRAARGYIRHGSARRSAAALRERVSPRSQSRPYAAVRAVLRADPDDGRHTRVGVAV